MTKVKDWGISGILGGRDLVAVDSKKGIYLRFKPRKRKASEWTDKQKGHRKCFAAVNMFAQSAKELLIKPIWNLSADDRQCGHNF